MSAINRFCSLIPGFGVKLSAIILAGPTAATRRSFFRLLQSMWLRFSEQWCPPLSSGWLHAVVVIPMALKPSGSQAANSLWARASNAPRDATRRYSAPISGIVAPQRVSNLRIVTKL